MAHEEVWTAIVFAFVAFAFFNFVMFWIITRKELKLLKVWFFMMFFFTGSSIGLLPFIISNNHGDETAISAIASIFIVIVALGSLLFVYNWLLKIILQTFKDVDDKAKAIKKEDDRGFL